MKKIIILIASIIIVCSVSAQNYYYYHNEKIYFEKNEYVRNIFISTSASEPQRKIFLDSLQKCVVRVDTFSSFAYRMFIDSSKLSSFDTTLMHNYAIITLNAPELERNQSKFWASREILLEIKPNYGLQSVLNSIEIPYGSFHQDQYNPAKYTVSLFSDSTIYYAQRLFETGCFVFSEPNFYGEAEIYGLEDNPLFYDQWAIHNDSVNINLLPAWNITHGDSKVKIALLDCGVDLDHSDLVDNLEFGYDAVNSDVYQVSAENGMYESAHDWHGTACAGVISSANNDDCGVGIAYGSRLIPIRITFTYVDHTNREQNPDDDNDIIYIQVWDNKWFIDAMDHACYIDKADIISCSFGLSQPSDAVESKIEEICSEGRNGKGMVMVAASGNTRSHSILSDTLKYIAKHPSVISVGSITQCGKRVKEDDFCVSNPDYNSCYGDSLDMVAPGIMISTTLIESDCYNSFGGTSAAAPHVAGVAALVLSVNPCLTREEVTYILESTCTKVRPDVYNYVNNSNHPNGTWNIEVGHGLVNAYEAVLLAQQMGGYVFRSQTEIHSNTLWDSVSLINDDLIIDSLATLTITDTLYIAGGSRIVVRPGGKLIVDGGTLTSACDGEMWEN